MHSLLKNNTHFLICNPCSNRYFRFRLCFANAINTYLRLEIRGVCCKIRKGSFIVFKKLVLTVSIKVFWYTKSMFPHFFILGLPEGLRCFKFHCIFSPSFYVLVSFYSKSDS